MGSYDVLHAIREVSSDYLSGYI